MTSKYDKIGTDYNLTRKADRHIIKRLFQYLNSESQGLYLDIGCGTGNYAIGLQKMGLKFIGIDPSVKMLNNAKGKNQEIDWRIGQAEKTDLQPESIDGIIAMLTIHHWMGLAKGFIEMHRILKINGTIVIFTSTPEQMKGYWLNHYFPKMLKKSMKQMPSFEKVKGAMEVAGFKVTKTEHYSVNPDLEDLFLYSGKHIPELYLSQAMRNGISSFASLASSEEIDEGIKQLRDDINTGKIKSVMKSYENNIGDYLFVIGKATNDALDT